MGFPPIGIMALAAVLKRSGHEVVLFDQANPDTPTPPGREDYWFAPAVP